MFFRKTGFHVSATCARLPSRRWRPLAGCAGDAESSWRLSLNLFDAGHPQSPRIKEVLVRRSIFDSGDHGRLVKGIVDFWNDLQDYGAFTRYEIPLPLLQSYHIDYYDGQVKNGGHEQFVSNGKWANYLGACPRNWVLLDDD